MSKIRQMNQNWYAANKIEFLQNKKNDYNNYYKYYYKCRVLLKKYPEVVIPNEILNMKIENKNEDYKKKYLQIKTIVDNYIINKIHNGIVEIPNQQRRTYKKPN